MSIDYSFHLCMGFEIDQQEVENIFVHKETDPGVFHMEDRFDPKTGIKIDPIKIWDEKPSTKKWVEYKGNKIKDLDPEEWETLLAEEFDCYVSQRGSFPTGKLTYVFSVNKPISWKDAENHGHITIYNNAIECFMIDALNQKAFSLKSKLEQRGYKIGDPKVFIATRIS